ncbi:hypothetical protein HUT06_11200 [Actinomadura sp. NAK00032]|uniref:hypothetical protein n=1 Tax=Actinomadura sp. NAK00032 TaxID=2742128 RepID=UPI001591BB60|nr:hypothetical protein [Actinomadura sp. NAK00032]QKW34522.1 hypothetical protein HUT06_11200 [Actinomadura sp. NAK00032]
MLGRRRTQGHAGHTKHGEAAEPRSDRRGFLGWAGRVGMGAVGVAAGVTALQQPGEAAVKWRCCNLYFGNPNCPISSTGNPYCRKGTMRVWYCCSGSRKYACGECTGGSSCGSGPFYCSAGWVVRANSC